MTTFFVVLAGLLIRIVLPLLVMLGLVYLLRRLDARWQADAIHQQKLTENGSQKHALDLKECCIDGIADGPSVQSAEPCWQFFRQSDGHLHEECLRCKVFRAAPIFLPNH